MSSIISLDHEIVQLSDTIGVLWVCQTSQRNWVAIKVYYGYLRKCLWAQRYLSVIRSDKSQSRSVSTQQILSEIPIVYLYSHPVTL